MSALWGFVLNLTVGDGLALLRTGQLYESVGVSSTDLGLRLQAERAMVAELLSQNRTSSPELNALQAQTTSTVNSFVKVATASDNRSIMSDTLQRSMDDLLGALDELSNIRDSVSVGKFNVLQAIVAYNTILDELFDVYEQMVQIPDVAMFQQASALVTMGTAHEMLAREDALVKGSLAQNQMSAEAHNAFAEFVALRKHYYAKNLPTLLPDVRGPYERVLNSDLYARFSELEDLILSQQRLGGALPADVMRWQPTTDSLVGELDRARGPATEALNAHSADLATGILGRIAIAGGVGLIAVVATIVFSVRFGRRLVADLADLRNAALELADQRLPQVVDRLKKGEDVDVEHEAPPIDAGGSMEVEDVGHAFSSVQRTAIEAAVGQAALRRGVGHVFLNLARRNQSLLHRQLTLLDSMQRRSKDPESLEDLFRLDHLTTRMRRHAEGLIILSGAAPGRSWRKPVPVVDVMRAAVAEVEDFTRVTVLPMPGASLTGAAVADVVHLLAELIENATIFSPPQTKVQVRAELVANGLVLEVEDRGLGLAPEEYAEINDKLASPPEFDLADSDRLGLFVVGQLAARYGISVVLRSSPYGGTTAIVLIPRSLVSDGTPGGAVPSRNGAHAALTAAESGDPSDLSDLGDHEPRHKKQEPEEEVVFRAEEKPSVEEPEPSPYFTPSERRIEAVPPVELVPPMEPEEKPALSARGLPTRTRTTAARPTLPNNMPTSVASGTHNGLPRRVRQANLAPQLMDTPLTAPVAETPEERSPEQARAMFSAFQHGARRGREDADYADNANGEKGEE
ncbi:nitrate- and nitrite sensing domain-containing protein [Herbidospora sp. NBRC 101105]|uniref:sensor histidine kinase n=1 Tax=Herbidospora sp. NBRC 101105 TaxID=3032195 RepID=UPI002554FC47|nr:nitrate- and nitrite sensing domain-containing protein [Herbidospora sp. NBRC 101105]